MRRLCLQFSDDHYVYLLYETVTLPLQISGVSSSFNS
jgi:hypothetical protein